MSLALIHQPILIGAWIGLVHAFDADHISTLGSLAVRDRPRSAIGYAARWACGHAVAIGALGGLALGVGMLWISSFSQVAEAAVAALLVALGLNAIRSGLARRQAAPAHPHRHTTGMLMGLLHGGAGSAAVLAILPLTGFDSGLAAAWFLLSFSLGVATGALIFAAVFSGILAGTLRAGAKLLRSVTVGVGAVAVFVGGSMLFGVLSGS